MTGKLEKRSKNVREQTRNISPEQGHQRILRYIRSRQIRTQQMSGQGFNQSFGHDAKGVHIKYDPPDETGSVVEPEHEYAHALMTPVGLNVNDQAKRLRTELAGNDLDDAIATSIQYGIARRAGASPRSAAIDIRNDHRNGELAGHFLDEDERQGLIHSATSLPEQAQPEAQRYLADHDAGLTKLNPKTGVMERGAGVHAKINARGAAKPMKKAENMDDKKQQIQPPQWMGRPIASADHHQDLETMAAVNEFHHRMPRTEAEGKAHEDYVKDQRERAAAHHLQGMKAAQATGNSEDAHKHWTMYDLHMKGLGKEAIGAIPPEIEKRMMEENKKPIYKFKTHRGDLFALDKGSGSPEPMAKGEVIDASDKFNDRRNARVAQMVQDHKPEAKEKKPNDTGKPCLRIHDKGNWTLCGASTDKTSSEFMGDERPSLKHMQADKHCDRCVSALKNDMKKAEGAKQCKWKLGERRCQRKVSTDYCHDHVDHWANKIKSREDASDAAKQLLKGIAEAAKAQLAKGDVVDLGAKRQEKVVKEKEAKKQKTLQNIDSMFQIFASDPGWKDVARKENLKLKEKHLKRGPQKFQPGAKVTCSHVACASPKDCSYPWVGTVSGHEEQIDPTEHHYTVKWATKNGPSEGLHPQSELVPHGAPVIKAEPVAGTAQLQAPAAAPALHSTVEGFMGGLKALPKGSPSRGKFITQHMNHGPFLTALKAHPQGQQIHTMLTGHLNGQANAGFKPGATQVVAKAEELTKGDVIQFPGNKAPAVDQGKDATLAGHVNSVAGIKYGEKDGKPSPKVTYRNPIPTTAEIRQKNKGKTDCRWCNDGAHSLLQDGGNLDEAIGSVSAKIFRSNNKNRTDPKEAHQSLASLMHARHSLRLKHRHLEVVPDKKPPGKPKK